LIATPSDALVIKLASIAVHAGELLAADDQPQKALVGITTVKNDRRRRMEAILVLLADAEVRNYLAQLKKVGLIKKP
jgi:hypothetical protein